MSSSACWRRSSEGVNWLDAFIVIVGIIWCIMRSRRGFVRVAVEFAGAALGLWAAATFTDMATETIGARWDVPALIGRPTAFIVLVSAPAIAGQSVSEWIAARRPYRRAARVDRLAGAVIGVVELIIVGAIALVAFVQWGGQVSSPPWADSVIIGWLLMLVPGLYEWAAEVLMR